VPTSVEHATAQLVETLRYKSESSGFDSGGVIFHWHNPSGHTIALATTQSLTEMSARNITFGRKGGRCLVLTTLPPSCAECLEIWEPQPPGTLRDCPGLYRDYFTFTFAISVQGTRWRSWLRHCATSRKVAGSIPHGVIGFFHRHNPSGRTMALGLTQPLTEISTSNVSLG